MKTFLLTATLGGADIRTMVKSDKIDDLVSDWEQAAKKLGAKDIHDVRDASREFVVQTIVDNQHNTDETAGMMVCSALLWLTVNGPLGEKLLPFMRRSVETAGDEITSPWAGI